MAEFSIEESALSGLRFVRRRPLVVAAWAVILLLARCGAVLLVISAAGSSIADFQAAVQKATPNPQAMFGAMERLAPVYLLSVLATIALYALLYAAANRAALAPEDSRFGYLRVGADELRQAALFIIFGFIALGLYFVAIAVAALAIALASAFGATAQSLLGLLLAPMILALFVFLSVRLSLASVLTFARRKIDLFGSWRLTRGRFWALLATYLVVGLIALVLFIISLTLSAATAALTGAHNGLSLFRAVFQADLSSVGRYLSAPRLVYLVASSILTAAALPILIMPAAVAYRQLDPGRYHSAGKETVEEVFA